MSLAKLVAFAEEGPWCATVSALLHPPRPGRVDRYVVGTTLGDEVALNPQPLPPHPEAAARLWQAVRLYQHAQMLAATPGTVALAEGLQQAAVRLYDGEEDVPTLPWLVLLAWLRRPPPPPPPWMDLIGHAASLALIGARMGSDYGEQLRSAAAAVILEQLGSNAAL